MWEVLVNDYKELVGLTVSVAEKTLASENMSLTVVSDGPERHDYTNDFKKGSIAATDYIISEVVHIDNENNKCLVFVKSNVQVMMEKEEEDFKKDQLNQVLDLKAAWEAFNQYANAGDMGVSVELYKFRSGPVEIDPNYKEEVGEDNTWILQCSAVVDGVEGRYAWAQIGGTTEHPYVIQCGAG